jgi:hypothetical protein
LLQQSGAVRFCMAPVVRGGSMERVLMALTASVMLAGLYPAWGGEPATANRQAPPSDPSDVEIVAVTPRSPDAKPALSSLPAGGAGQRVAANPAVPPVAKPAVQIDD